MTNVTGPENMPPEFSPDPVWKRYFVGPGATKDDFVEVALQMHADLDGEAGELVFIDGVNHYATVYNVSEATIGPIHFKFETKPDHIGPVVDNQPAPDPLPLDDPIPDPFPQRKGFVTARALNVRSSPMVRSDNKVGVLPQGATVWILGEENGWLQIVFDIPAGYAYVGKGYINEP